MDWAENCDECKFNVNNSCTKYYDRVDDIYHEYFGKYDCKNFEEKLKASDIEWNSYFRYNIGDKNDC